MLKNIQRIRKSLSMIELEDGEKHPNRPNYRVMLRECEEAEYEIQRIKRLIQDLGDI